MKSPPPTHGRVAGAAGSGGGGNCPVQSWN